MEAASFADVLQIAGWLLTVLGQVQVAWKARQGFITWIAANAMLIVLCVHVGLVVVGWHVRDERRSLPVVVPALGQQGLKRGPPL